MVQIAPVPGGKIMKKLKKRISAAACSAVVAGVAVLGAGGAASAATPVSAAVSVKASDDRWDHGVGYLLEEGYSWDRSRGWHHDDCVTDSDWYGRNGHSYRWDDKECGRKSYGSYRHDWNRCEHDGQDRNYYDRNYYDR
ncbi:hypothetical protein [Streptomyces sp. NPDC004533]|uniref:hypothetical protein n=1 Tax=Streptomyces sp. NPDC004533 TaxID=3154278 RepID=UPI0033A5A6F2